MKPARIQLSRRKGFNLQEASLALNGLPAIVVARPTRWGNPYQAGHDGDGDRAMLARLYGDYVRRFEQADLKLAIREHLAGHNLACWCPLDGPCHADVLLEIANGPKGQKGDCPPATFRGTDRTDVREDR